MARLTSSMHETIRGVQVFTEIFSREGGNEDLPESEPHVAAGGDLVASLPILGGAARVDDERALLLARHVGVDAHHSGIDLREEHAPPGVVHVPGPVPLRFGSGLDARVTVVAH